MKLDPRRKFVLALVAALVIGGLAPAIAQDDDGYRTVAAYLVSDDGSLARAPGSGRAPSSQTDKSYRAAWEHVKAVLTPLVLERVSRLEIFVYDGHDTYITDATATLADDDKTWILGLNWNMAQEALSGGSRSALRSFDSTIVHEAAHILALSPDQMHKGAGRPKGTFHVSEGTTRPDAWLNQFWLAFWKDGYPDWSGEEDEEGAKALRMAHPGAFVSQYAATSPGEDFAETFAAFVMLARPEEAKRERDAKMLFFYNYPELVALRDSMRAAMGLGQADPVAQTASDAQPAPEAQADPAAQPAPELQPAPEGQAVPDEEPALAEEPVPAQDNEVTSKPAQEGQPGQDGEPDPVEPADPTEPADPGVHEIES